jgi:hypothetical protein
LVKQILAFVLQPVAMGELARAVPRVLDGKATA